MRNGVLNTAILCCGPTGLKGLKAVCSYSKPVLVATSDASTEIKDFCLKHNVPIFIGTPRRSRLLNFIVERGLDADLLISINYLYIIEQDVISLFRWAINLHGSLLPQYRGRTPNVWAIINNESFTGVTAHFMVSDCDAGPIVLQKSVPIERGDTGGTLVEKLVALYPDIIENIISQAKKGTLLGNAQDETMATYFGRRTPDDGWINWSWSRERIVNWVRAQANPYPGAFSWLDDEKIVIDEVRPVNYGYHYKIRDGTVLSTTPRIIIKSGTGPLELTQIRESSHKEFRTGAILD